MLKFNGLFLSTHLRTIDLAKHVRTTRGGVALAPRFRSYQTKSPDDLAKVDESKSDVIEPKDPRQKRYESYLKPQFKGDDVGHVSPYGTKPLKNRPFLKALFSGEYLFDYLKFPETPSTRDLDAFNNNHVAPLTDYVKTSRYDQVVDQESGNFTASSLKKFNELNLVRQSLPVQFGGLGLEQLQQTRLLEETGVYPSLGMQLIYNNVLGANCIAKFGSDQLKAKYLPRIASGELKVAFCYTEEQTGVDVSRFTTYARLSYAPNTTGTNQASSDKYVLNGKKSWTSILTSDPSNTLENEQNIIFIVFAKTTLSTQADKDTSTKPLNEQDVNEVYEKIKNKQFERLNAFVVDRQALTNSNQISIRKQLNDFNGLNLYDISFDNVELSGDQLLGEQGEAFNISSSLMESARYLVGALCVGLLKDLFKTVVEFTINNKQFKRSIQEYPIIKLRLCNIEKRLFAMESMCYMTAGIIDSYQTADVGLESAVTKIFCTEGLVESVNDCMEILAMSSFSKLDDMKHRYLNDVNYLLSMLNTNDTLRNYVAINGLTTAGLKLHDEIFKIKNPLMFPVYVVQQFVKNLRISRSIQKKAPEYLFLWEHVHPSLNNSAANLEQMAVRFIMAVKSSFVADGRDIVENQLNLKRLSDMLTDIYAANCMMARASRSYSIGLRNGAHEIALCDLFTAQANKRVRVLLEEISQTLNGENLDGLKINVANQIIRAGSHAATHSTARNY